ncbi:hypothetical protein DWQ67_00010 [Galactobacter caseinivorans]|uniref:Uncharacterized protein n=1 Tax=Galactobacter caseinivorans TaxID=2676123 RepID=A0A496PL60_9MICC|nr:hypothetical protein DWQ67_00010 [Galactobacter caseinivorans]
MNAFCPSKVFFFASAGRTGLGTFLAGDVLVAGTYALFGLGLSVGLPLGLDDGDDANGVGLPNGILV